MDRNRLSKQVNGMDISRKTKERKTKNNVGNEDTESDK
jgi:hypothetical protein